MFNLEDLDNATAKNLSPQVLAFVGDGVYSLYIRQMLVTTSKLKGKDLHNEVTSYVKARGQSNFIDKLLPVFDEIEMAIFKRARNHKTLSQAKNQNIIDYRRATGLEAVLGYLYLTGNMTRLNEILKLSIGENNED
ncbi:MAG: Mini-ribonuclease 3 [Christensenellales bacterium]